MSKNMRMVGLDGFNGHKDFPRLKAGERITFEPGGQVYEVERVSFGAAYVRKVFDPPRLVEFTKPDGTTVKMIQSYGQMEPGISPRAAVYRVRKEP